jgi:hypothetical protein
VDRGRGRDELHRLSQYPSQSCRVPEVAACCGDHRHELRRFDRFREANLLLQRRIGERARDGVLSLRDEVLCESEDRESLHVYRYDPEDKFRETLGDKMLTWLPVILTMLTTMLTAIFTPTFVAAHLTLFAVLNALAQLLHAVLPSTVAPSSSASTRPGRNVG